MDSESQRVLTYLTEIEEAAEDVLTTKQQVFEYLPGVLCRKGAKTTVR